MLIDPYIYCVDLLKEKTLSEMESKIRGLRQGMSRLKTIVESPRYKEKIDISYPDEYTQISWYRDCIMYARTLYEQAGGVYKPSKLEEKDNEFDARIEMIETIKFTRSESFKDDRTLTVSFAGEDVVLRKSLPFSGYSEQIVMKRSKTIWLERFRDAHIGEWRRSYNSERYGISVNDVKQWELEIVYQDVKRKKYDGSNVYPFSYNELLVLFELI